LFELENESDFRTNVGNVCGRDFVEDLMGHSFYMDTYYQLPEEKKRQMYLEAEPHLTITDTKSIENNFKSLSAKHNALEVKVDRVALLPLIVSHSYH